MGGERRGAPNGETGRIVTSVTRILPGPDPGAREIG